MYNRRVVLIWSKCMCARTVITTIDVRQSHLCQEFLTVLITSNITYIKAFFLVFHGLSMCVLVYGLF